VCPGQAKSVSSSGLDMPGFDLPAHQIEGTSFAWLGPPPRSWRNSLFLASMGMPFRHGLLGWVLLAAGLSARDQQAVNKTSIADSVLVLRTALCLLFLYLLGWLHSCQLFPTRSSACYLARLTHRLLHQIQRCLFLSSLSLPLPVGFNR
jgi:hypothetical protein